MGEKKTIDISLKIIYIIVLLLLALIFSIIYLIFNNSNNVKKTNTNSGEKYVSNNNYSNTNNNQPVEDNEINELENWKTSYNGEEYYIINHDYSGEYDLGIIEVNNEINNDFDKKEVMSYEQYEEYCNKYGLNKKYKDKAKNYIVFSYRFDYVGEISARLGGVEFPRVDTVNLYIWDQHKMLTDKKRRAYYIIIPTDKNVGKVNVFPAYTKEQYTALTRRVVDYEDDIDIAVPTLKPIIYFYPEKETKINVKLGYPNKIMVSYPNYKSEGWDVIAYPNGNLKYIENGRNLYSLYYESDSVYDFKVEKDGFIVKRDEIEKFLEEKLEILGLNEKESEEFIIYWLPKLQEHEYNYIRFATMDEINKNMPIDFSVTPDTLIRVLMTYKGLDTPIEVKEQKLNKVYRKGFVIVEWGGTEIR
ncbi:MAG: hypothetical protein IKG42_01665 [Clostridia bacterium]|nr:hypothetical protein [Clostridia bacterium]